MSFGGRKGVNNSSETIEADLETKIRIRGGRMIGRSRGSRGVRAHNSSVVHTLQVSLSLTAAEPGDRKSPQDGFIHDKSDLEPIMTQFSK